MASIASFLDGGVNGFWIGGTIIVMLVVYWRNQPKPAKRKRVVRHHSRVKPTRLFAKPPKITLRNVGFWLFVAWLWYLSGVMVYAMIRLAIEKRL